MSRAKIEGAYLFAAGAVLFLLVGCLCETSMYIRMIDFKAVYYASQALDHHQDPYSDATLSSIFNSAPENSDLLLHDRLHVATTCVNLPTTLLLAAPLSLLPWEPARLLWMALTAGSLLLSAYLMWVVGAAYAPRASGLLSLLFLTGSPELLQVGNAAGIVVGLCMIAAWCFIRRKHEIAGVILLAIGLVLKPQDAGFVWLYFLLAGGTHRRRALQTLGLVAVISIAAVAWVSQSSPHWIQELQANVLYSTAPGRVNDPTPPNVEPAWAGSVMVSLQTVTSFISTRPQTYNLLAYGLCAPIILLWAFSVVRLPSSEKKDWLGLAAIVPISMLVCYHRQHDTRLLLLAIPVIAMLYTVGRRAGRIGLALGVLTAICTSNFFLQTLGTLTLHLRSSTGGIGGQLLNASLGRLAPLSIFASGVFFCVVLMRRSFAVGMSTLPARANSVEEFEAGRALRPLVSAPAARAASDC